MTLPYDYARCEGVQHDGCEDCQRRTSPGRPERQAYIQPPEIIIECDFRVPPENES